MSKFKSASDIAKSLKFMYKVHK